MSLPLAVPPCIYFFHKVKVCFLNSHGHSHSTFHYSYHCIISLFIPFTIIFFWEQFIDKCFCFTFFKMKVPRTSGWYINLIKGSMYFSPRYTMMFLPLRKNADYFRMSWYFCMWLIITSNHSWFCSLS